VSVTEGELASILQNDSGSWLLQGEVLAAARALRGGDPTPLLRLDAESVPSSSGGPPPEPTLFSAGDAFARSCTDLEYQWDKASSPAQRRVQFDQARAALDPNRFAPFSLDAWVQPPPVAFLPSPCIRWPAPTHHPAPPVPIGTIVPDLPALLLMGELDLRVPPSESAQLTRMVPRTSAVTVAESGHVTAFNEQSGCARALISHFIDTMTPGDTTCARHPAYIAPAVGSFPRRATTEPDSRTEEASEGAADERSLRGRVARIATATLTDAFRRTFIQEQPAHKGVGLRGGTFHAKETRTGLTLHLAAARLTEDVAVTGDATYNGTLDADLSVAGAAQGTLHVHGIWNEPGATRLVINGQLDGHQIGISVSAT
jgi:hypothetical protein